MPLQMLRTGFFALAMVGLAALTMASYSHAKAMIGNQRQIAEARHALASGDLREFEAILSGPHVSGGLRQDPLAEHALAGLALRRPDHSVQLITMAERTTRRSTLVELWLVEAAVNSGNQTQALVHYDRALSVAPGLQRILFPILFEAMRGDPGNPDLVPFQDRDWFAAFKTYSAKRNCQSDKARTGATSASRLPANSLAEIC